MAGLAQPREGASMIPHSSAVSAEIEISAPRVSSGGVSGSLDSGTSRFAATSAATTIGTLTRNTDPQEKLFRSRPPVTGPATIPMPQTEDQIPIAFARSEAGKEFG